MADMNQTLSDPPQKGLYTLLPTATDPVDGCGAESEGAEEKGKDEDVQGAAVHDDSSGGATSNPQGCLSSFRKWLSSNAFLIYTSQLLSAWSDRMWTFAVALYLVKIEPDNNLRLTAIFGFAINISVLLFGPLVGQWVDRMPRLSATRRSLIIQNSGVMIDAICLLLLLHYKDAVMAVGDGVLYFFCQMLIILLGVIANLASVAQKICIEKDWVVILAGNSKERLAEMNANVRRIDLTVNTLAPILVGQIMTFTSLQAAGIFIAAWNLVSLAVEYYLLIRVYKKVPRLAIKLSQPMTGEGTDLEAEPLKSPGVPDDKPSEEGIGLAQADQEPTSTEAQPPQPRRRFGFLHRVANWFLSTYHGWLIYKSYPVYLAGLGLAFLYMTVMGFGPVSNGYGYALGLSESMLGIAGALGSIAGIAGTFLFQRMRKTIGVTRTGLYALAEEILFLTLCVASIWVPGSPFVPNYLSGESNFTTASPPGKPTSVASTFLPSFTSTSIFSSPPLTSHGFTDLTVTSNPEQSGITHIYTETTWNGIWETTTPQMTTYTTSTQDPRSPTSYVSAVLFFTGMVASRVGLWMYDLVTTQLIQENVREDQRGVFNGMQRALECSMDMLHFILVIALPTPETFGYLIILSMLFIFTGAALFSAFAFKDRGHLFHPEKVMVCLQNGRCANGSRPVQENEAGQAV